MARRRSGEDSDQDVNEATNGTAHTATRRSKRIKVMSESTQTDDERRKLRIAQRDLKHKIQDERSDLSEKIKDPDSEAFRRVRETNNKLFEDVRYTREAVLDSENVEIISTRAARMADKLMAAPRYDAMRFITKLRSKCIMKVEEGDGAGGFDWRIFSIEAGSCFNAVPSKVSFLNGPIDAEYEPKQRKKPVRRRVQQEEDVEEEEVDSVQQKKRNKDQDKLSAAEKQVSDVLKKLSKRTKEDEDAKLTQYEESIGKKADDWDGSTVKTYRRDQRPGQVDAVKFLFNPKSFTQTIENIFSYSFLVKKGDAKIGMRSEEDATEGAPAGPWVSSADSSKENSSRANRAKPPKQAIVALSMHQWRQVVKAYELEEGDLPHRGKSRYARK